MQQRFSLKKILVSLLMLSIVLIGARVTYYFLTTAPITISAKGANFVSISPLDNSNESRQNQGGDTLSLRLTAGDYTVTVMRDDTTTKQLITVVARKSQRVSVALKTIGTIEPVSPRSVSSVYADQQGLVYLDTNNDNLYRVTSDNTERLITIPETLRTIKWADSQFGIAQGQSGKLYTVNGQTVQNLRLPNGASASSYAISKDRRLFVVVNRLMYESVNSGSFKKIATPLIKNPTVLAVSNTGNVLLQEDVSDGKSEELTFNFSVLTGSDIGPKKTFKTGHTTGFQVAWSPSGDQILIASPDGVTISDTKLSVIAKLPSNNVQSPAWVNDQVVAYGIANKIWAYDTTLRSSYALGATYNKESVNNVYSGNDGDSVYLNLQNNSTGQQLGRLSISDPQKNSDLRGLAIILPNTLGECSYGYVNFTRMIMTAYGPDISRTECTQKGTDYLKSYKADLGNLQLPIVFNPGN